jgi:RNA polymerase sigma-70 factor (ECF subfamily)
MERISCNWVAQHRSATVESMRSEIEEAVRLLQCGDEKSLEQALSLLQETVFSFSMHVCGQREDAEDTMQEVLLKAVPYLANFDSPKALLVWMYKVAKNHCLMSRRRSKFAPAQELSLEQLMPDRKELEQLNTASVINPELLAMQGERAECLRKAVQKLPPQYRIVLVLRDMEGLSDHEVAEITGIRSGTVRVRLHRARLFVRKELMKMFASHPRKLAKTQVLESGSPRPKRCRALFAELSNYLDETLDDSVCDQLERHLEGCGPCQAFLNTLEATIAACRQMPEHDSDPRKMAKLRSEIKVRYQSLKEAITQ